MYCTKICQSFLKNLPQHRTANGTGISLYIINFPVTHSQVWPQGGTLCLLLVTCYPALPPAWTSCRRLNPVPHQHHAGKEAGISFCTIKKADLSKGGQAPCEPTANIQTAVLFVNPTTVPHQATSLLLRTSQCRQLIGFLTSQERCCSCI